VWNGIIRPKRRSANPWRDVAIGCFALVLPGVVLLLLLPHDYTNTRIFCVIGIVAGVRWIAVGVVHRRDLARG
jgi:hypothetical protein